MAQKKFPKILLFGCGNMAGAMLRGWLAAGVPPSRFAVVKPSPDNLPAKITYFADAGAVTGKYDLLLLGIKPQLLPSVADEVRPLLTAECKLVSILAGVELEDLQQLFPERQVIRVMPNLSVELGLSPLGIWAGDVDKAERKEIDALLAPIGFPEWLESEDQMDAFTALAGSGPAFVYRFVDALAAGGMATGLDQEQASRIALKMVVGAAELAAASQASPGELARNVASPGGMTAEGLDILDADGALGALVKNALRAARDRGAELAKLARGES